jgi:hypothetical protein
LTPTPDELADPDFQLAQYYEHFSKRAPGKFSLLLPPRELDTVPEAKRARVIELLRLDAERIEEADESMDPINVAGRETEEAEAETLQEKWSVSQSI